jgi:hypothetical protein
VVLVAVEAPLGGDAFEGGLSVRIGLVSGDVKGARMPGTASVEGVVDDVVVRTV